jgi:hypothetical protein
MSIDSTKYPQLSVMVSVQGQSQAIGDFIEWLGENGMVICTSSEGLRGTNFCPVLESTEKLLARHFGVDLDAVERERRQMLAEFSRTQALTAP